MFFDLNLPSEGKNELVRRAMVAQAICSGTFHSFSWSSLCSNKAAACICSISILVDCKVVVLSMMIWQTMLLPVNNVLHGGRPENNKWCL